MRYAFAAVASYGDPPQPVALPPCADAGNPVPDFITVPAAPREGQNIQFTDTSTVQGGTIATWSWDFGDGETSDVAAPIHVYKDNGTYTVLLRVTTADGLIGALNRSITVTNAPPEASVGDVLVLEGNPVILQLHISDPGLADRAALSYALDSSAFPSQTGTVAAGDYLFDAGALPAGTHVVVLSVSDKDGAETVVGATITVIPAGAAPPAPFAPNLRTGRAAARSAP